MSRARRLPPGRGAAMARQMGLVPELGPAGDPPGDDTAELEAELLALVGGGQTRLAEKPGGRAALPMEAIEEMAALCMRDPEEEEEEEELEDEDDLMAELQEVLGADPGSKATPEPPAKVPGQQGGMEALLAERAALYQAALCSARQAGDGARLRRLERGLKTLQSLLLAARKGKEIKEEEIPPPVALGKGSSTPQPAPVPPQPAPVPPQPSLAPPQPAPVPPQPSLAPPHPTPVPPQPSLAPPQPAPVPPQPSLAPPQPAPVPPQPSPAPPASPPATSQPPSALPEPQALPSSSAAASSLPSHPGGAGMEALLLRRQREYKVLALQAKQLGDMEAATRAYRTAKSFDALLEAAAKGQPVEPGTVPPAPEPLPKEPPAPAQPQPGTAGALPPAAAAPRDLLEALRQRMEKYQEAARAAQGRGEERKARMHQRIVKQYQDAIRAQQAGRAVNLSELPVPPGCQPIQGVEAAAGQQSLAGVLEAALKLAKQEEEEEEEKEEEEEEKDGTEEAKPAAPQPCPAGPCPPPAAPSRPQPPAAPRASSSGGGGAAGCAGPPRAAPKAAARAQLQLEFLEGRRRQLLQAALRAKHGSDLRGAKLCLRQARALQPLLEASRGGLPVDISKVPEPPLDQEQFVLGQRREGQQLPPEAAGHYLELVKLIRQQHELCVSLSRQFAHLGNISETTKLEKLAEDCRQQMESLRQAHARGWHPPKHHYEQRTLSTIKLFPELGSSDLVVSIVRGINLPAPAGLAPSDLETFVRLDFPYPSAEQSQRHRTAVSRSSHCPEFQQQFKLHIDRGHRGLRRVLHAKGIKFEVAHKGGLFKPERLLGTAQLKLEALETTCELRQLLELLDGRRRTGGRLEVELRLREPLSCPQLEPRTQRWLVIDPCPPLPAVSVPRPKPSVVPAKEVHSRATTAGGGGGRAGVPCREQQGPRPVPTLPSLNLLAFEREKLERKLLSYSQAQRPVPPELQRQHQELCRRCQALRARLQQGDPHFRQEYQAQLQRYLQLYSDSARSLGTQGHRDAAKEALYKRNLVESELQKLRC